MTAFVTGGVLFLDLSTETGWAYGLPGSGQPHWGVWKLPDTFDLGRRMCAFENVLLEFFDKYRPSLVSIEAPLPANQQSNASTAEILIGLAIVTEMCAYRWKIKFARRSSHTVRSAVIGRSRITQDEKRQRGSVKKTIVEPWIAAMGWVIPNHNARDAAIGWAYETGIRAGASKAQRAA